MKKLLIALVIIAMSVTAAQAAPKSDNGKGPPVKENDWICFAPFFGHGKWCHKFGNWFW